MGRDFEGSLTPAACPLGGAFALDFYCTLAHICSTDLTKQTAPVEGN